jgi:deoxyribonuclease IV
VSIDGPRLGVHLPHARGLLKAVDRAIEIGAEAVQVFADNPTAWRRRAELPPELPEFRRRLASAGVEPLAIHAAYLVNLAGSDAHFHRQSITLLVSDLRSGAAYGAQYVNVHIGSHLGSGPEQAVEQVARAVEAALAETADIAARPMVVLENSAGGGNGFGASVDELASIFEGIGRRGIPRDAVGLCLDTAHLWGAGYALDDPVALDALFAEIDGTIGLDRLVMLHLNDSKAERGSRADRHEHIGAGRIGPARLGAVLRHPAVRGRVAYLETPGMDEGFDLVNLRRARDLLAGRSLDPLPPEAFDLQPRRGRRVAASVGSARGPA